MNLAKISTFLKNLITGQNVDGLYSDCNRDKQVELQWNSAIMTT